MEGVVEVPHVTVGARARSRARREHATQLGLIAVQLGLLVFVIGRFEIESGAFHRLSMLAAVGFVVHALLPMRLRLPCFLALSLLGIGIVLGAYAAAWLVGLGLGLVAICHLPLRFAGRVVLLLVAGAALAGMRGGWLPQPGPSTFWPILGSMFMFRLIVYMYDLRHEPKDARSAWFTLSYFFLLPNVCFPLFPVVDYKGFRRSHYNDDAYRIHQIGVAWMVRGVVHLLLYRCVYYYCTLAPSDVASLGDLVQFLLSNIALYLRVSGTFHLIVGMLRLFGFNLPETHLLYFLAASVNDFWRRINIYWKDFLLKVFFFRAFFALRRRSGEVAALALATLVVVVASWALHSYQWFWLRGSFPIRWQDAAFWGALGSVMVVNSIHERKARGRTARAWRARDLLRQGLQVAATFTFICVLWSLWTCESWDEWQALWRFAQERGPATAGATGAGPLLACVLATATVLHGSGGGSSPRPGVGRPAPSLRRTTGITIATLLVLCGLGSPSVYSRFEDRFAAWVASLRTNRLSRVDAVQLQRGYYEDLLNIDRFNANLWELYKAKPHDWLDLTETGILRGRGDFLTVELAPSTAITPNHTPFSTNAWGMRDREYALAKPRGTRRIAVLGASYAMGWGVGDHETFEAALEERLNGGALAGSSPRYEILNLAVASYSSLRRLRTLEEKGFRFEPDAVFYVAHEREPEIQETIRQLVNATRTRRVIPYPEIEELLRSAGVDAGTPRATAESLLAPRGDELIAWVYRRIARECTARGVAPVWIHLPTIEMLGSESDVDQQLELARNAGFLAISLDGVYDGHDPATIRVAEWDLHPNALGHRLIADRIFEELRRAEAPILAVSTGAASGAAGPR